MKTKRTSSQNLRLKSLVVVSSVAMAIAACTSAPVDQVAENQPPEHLVASRASLRWQHLVSGEFEKAYAMATPSYRALHTFQEYRGTFQGAVKWRGAKVISASCEPEKCEVRVELTVLNPLARRADDTLTTYFTETWLRSEGGWYHHEKP